MIKSIMCLLNDLFVIFLITAGPFLLAFAIGWWLGRV